MNEQEKLRVLIPHWIEHNEEHADEFRRWAEQAGEAAADIMAAAETMTRVNDFLGTALEELGGSLTVSHPEHHHEG